MREIDRLHRLAIRFVPAGDYREALSLLESGKAEALAADDVLLRGVLVETQKSAGYRFVGDLLSFEPYGIMYARSDPGLEAVVERALRDLAESREIEGTYNRWFLRPLPSGGRIDLPMSAQLRRYFELIGLPPD
jgi:glutamate/aspartate transport system substrate-binding protein